MSVSVTIETCSLIHRAKMPYFSACSLVLFRSCVISQSTICHFNMSVSHIHHYIVLFVSVFFLPLFLAHSPFCRSFCLRLHMVVGISGPLFPVILGWLVCGWCFRRKHDNMEFKTSINAMGRRENSDTIHNIVDVWCFWNILTLSHSHTHTHAKKRHWVNDARNETLKN